MSSAGSLVRLTFEGMASGTKGLAILIRAYFDESAEGDSRRGIFTVSGYVFTSSKLRALEREWRKMLAEYQLPYFHMAECNGDDPLPKDNVFRHLNKLKRVECQTVAIKIARENTLHGYACILKQEDYREILENDGFACDSYSFLLWATLIQMAKWRNQERPKDDLSLFFEQGYKTQSRANELLQFVSQDPRMKDNVRMTGHSFFNKDASYPGQAADLIAWHVRKGYANLSKDKALRRDTEALFDGKRIQTIRFDRAQLTILRDKFIRHAGSLERAARILFNPNGPLLVD